MLKLFLLAVQFLTIIPVRVKKTTPRKLAKSVIFYPIVGLLIGTLLVAAYSTMQAIDISPTGQSIILTVILAVITGGMHLDGMADTADGLMSGKSRDEMLKIMKDPHIGAMGVIAIACVLLLKIALLSNLHTGNIAAGLLLMCVIGRLTPVLLMYAFTYARKDGKSQVFMQGMNNRTCGIAAALAVFLCFCVYGLKGFLILTLVSGSILLIVNRINRRLGGITGDVLGASIEISEIAALFFLVF
jgi:adenosylcobinamide-GDP ribazoletransferase